MTMRSIFETAGGKGNLVSGNYLFRYFRFFRERVSANPRIFRFRGKIFRPPQ